MKNYFLFFAFLILSCSFAFAQLDTTNAINDDLIENLFDETDEETDNAELVDILEDLERNPIDINTADLLELLRLPGLDQPTVKQIIDHRDKFGKFYSVNELYSIRGIDDQLIQDIIPFITISNGEKTKIQEQTLSDVKSNFFSKSRLFFRSRFTNDLQNRAGFLDGKYLGSKLKNYNRLIYDYNSNYQIGILTEKDPGEKSFTDFTSFHIQIKNVGILNNFIAGDYALEYGQGLALWSAFGFSKGTDAIYPAKKKARFLRPYTSSAEYRFFRGTAARIKLENFNVTGFYSSNSLDASIDPYTNEITSLGQTGYHRFDSEIIKKNAANSKIIGGVIDYQYEGRYNLGVIYYNATFNKNFATQDIYDIAGNRFNYLSTYYDFNFKTINLFGEFSFDGTSVASINGLQISTTRDLIFVTSIRSYPRNYNNLYGFGFSERSGRINNEFGIYSGIKWRLPIGIIDLYYDNFKFPYKTFENSLSSEGDEFLISFISKLISRLEARLRYKYENKEVSEIVDLNENIVRRLKQSIRAEFNYKISNNIRLKTRIEYNNFFIKDAELNENGFLMFEDIRFLPHPNLNLYGRIIFFQTDSFNSAIYEYENDLIGVMPNLAMYGKGIRMYLIIKYRLLNYLSISAKYSETYKPDETSLSSGDNEILGNVDNRISFQIDLNL